MSDVVSALNGKSMPGDVTITEAGLRGMITLRGDLGNSRVRSVCTGLTGVDFPLQGQANCVGEQGLAWMSPDEVLVLVRHDAVDAALAKIANSLKNQHHLAVNVSDARAVIMVEGAFARDVIARLAPADLHPQSFATGTIRRTRLGQIAAAFWMRDETTFEVICFRSVAQYAFDMLANAAAAGPVGHFPAAQ